MINIALPKGRLGEKVYSMFEKAGYECPSIKEVNRKLVFENAEEEKHREEKIILYYAHTGEKIWDIARENRCSAQRIKEFMYSNRFCHIHTFRKIVSCKHLSNRNS